MANRRKSAFSVYAETKPEEPAPQLESSSKKLHYNNNNNKSNTKKNQNNHIVPNKEQKTKQLPKKIQNNGVQDWHKPLNGGGVLKRKVELNIKKENKNKFAKLPIEEINTSIQMFNGKTSGSNGSISNNTKKKAFTPKQIQSHVVLSEKEFRKFVQDTKDNKLRKLAAKPVKILKEVDDEDEDDTNTLIDEEMFDSRKEATRLFKTIISPTTNKDFFKNFWEKKPMLVRRQDPTYYQNWFSCIELDSILRKQNLEFTTNIDVTTYVDGVKQKHNPEGKAYAPLVWDYFQQGCSIRVLNPQTYSRNIWQYLSTLQELFGTCVGANVYLTPQGTQGFAPHYDDIEAFVLQLEGKKRWRVYEPLSKDEKLPRFSSPNFEQSQIGKPIIDVILEQGDLLYFPRGYIHQAVACNDIHSLHITVSCYQKNTWGDFLLKLLPGAVEVAMQDDLEFRRGLPINYLVNNGVAYDDDKLKKEFEDKTSRLIGRLINYLPIDSAVDQLGKQFLFDSLPPCLTESEKMRSIHGNGEKWNETKNRVDNVIELEPDTPIKLIRKNCLRLVVEENSCLVYHNLDNSRIYQGKEPQYLEVENTAAPAVEFLINSYPNYVTIDEIPLETVEEKLAVASGLYDKGLLVTGEPLTSNSDSDEEENDDYDEEAENGENNETDEENKNMEDYEEDDDDDEEIDDDFDSEEFDKDAEEIENGSENEGDENNEEEHDVNDDDDDENDE